MDYGSNGHIGTWLVGMIPRPDDAAGYLERVRTVRDVFPDLPWAPGLPDSMNHLDYEGANNIERALLGVSQAIERMEDSWFSSGEIDAGGF